MGQATITANTGNTNKRGEIHNLGSSKLVVEQVEIVRQREVIKVPEIVVVPQETIKYEVKKEETIKYVPKEEKTIKYNLIEETTKRYNVEYEPTIKYVPKEVQIEKPVCVEKEYEKPVIKEKEYVVATVQDVEVVKELLSLLPKLMPLLRELKDYKLVEKILEIPKVEYVPTQVERVVWSDVNKCKKCGSLTHAD